MATTPNFNWSTPDNTGLVKNGALDIRTLGNSIDASLVDLKGGTTGQILAKTTNTDMDFTWVTNDVGDITAVTAGTGISGGGTSGAVTITNSMATEITAKGDLIVGTGSATFDNLAAGSNGDTIVADSSTSTGLRYQVPVNVNPILNSSFQIWQRGTSFTYGGGGIAYQADRWQGWGTGGGTAYTVTRQATGDTTNLPNIQYCLRMQRPSGNTNTEFWVVLQSMESVNSIPYAGKTVTLSFYARKGANFSGTSSAIQALLYSGTGTDQNLSSGFTGSATPINSTATLTTTWQRFSYTGTISSTATQLGLNFNFQGSGTAGAADFFEITGVQLEAGSVATPFKTYAGTIQGELAACQRYLPSYDNAASSNNGWISGYAYGTNTSIFIVPFPVTARVNPTGITVSGTINAFALNTSTSVTPTFDAAGIQSAAILASHTITAGQAARMGITSGAKLLFTGCEL